jgi:serine phosphatase RsbU (regulator of sigma subunit)
MTDPKTFYRELDALLAKIRIEEGGEDLLNFIVEELQVSFGARLHINNGRIYELRGDEFVLIYSIHETHHHSHTAKLPVNSDVVQLAFKNRSYIYDRPEMNNKFGIYDSHEYVINAAIWVHSTDRQWLLVFELKEGWVREEISLFLNSVRTALNYRLFSEFMGNVMEKAKQIQQSLLPQETPEVKGFQIAGRSQAAEFVGGDFYEYFDVGDGTFGVSIGDASGHGFPAALLVRDVVIGLRMGMATEFRPVYMIKKLNQVIQRSTYATNYVSLFFGEIEAGGHLFYVNAGHPGPFLISGKSVKQLEATGITLGFMPEIDLHRNYVRIEQNAVLVLFSDGIVERINAQDEMFGNKRLTDVIMQNQDKDAVQILDIIFDTVYEFGNRVAWEDDATLVVIKRVE